MKRVTKMKKNNIIQLFMLIGSNVFIFFLLVFLGKLLASVFVYFKVGFFLFDFKETIFIALKRGSTIGLALGVGLWIKARILERKHGKNPTR